MKLRIGKRYRNHYGDIYFITHKIRNRNEFFNIYDYIGVLCESTTSIKELRPANRLFIEKRFRSNGTFFDSAESIEDLIEEVKNIEDTKLGKTLYR